MRRILSLSLIFLMLLFTGNSFANAAVPTGPSTTATNIMVPVVLWHVVTPNPSGRYQISVQKFEEQIAYLNANGYTTLSIDEYYNIMTLQQTPPAKPILLTFDDNTSDYYTYVYPILKKYNMKAVQFAVKDWVDQPGYLTSAQLQALAADNTDVQNHTMDHNDLSTLTYEKQYTSISTNNTFLTSITNKKPEFLAYPYGRNNGDSILASQALGIKMALKVGGGKTTPADNFYELGRAMVVSSDTLSSFIKKIQ